MVWIGISLDVVTEFVVLDRDNLNAHRYPTNILEPYALIRRARRHLYAR
jgi:hypothetical protein